MINFAPYITLIWIAFWIYWFSRTGTSKISKYWTIRFVVARLILLILISLLIHRASINASSLDDHNAGLQTVGFILFLSGLTLAIWARVNLGRSWGGPMSKKPHPKLVMTGPYHYVRHPIYTGILLGFTGTAIATSYYWFIAVVLFGTIFIYAAVAEEKYMSEQLPELYTNYKKRTKMLIPFIF